MTFQKPEGVCSDGVIWISFTSVSLTDTSNPNDRFGLNDTFGRFWGKHVAHMGQARYPTWASTLPQVGRFHFLSVPKSVSRIGH